MTVAEQHRGDGQTHALDIYLHGEHIGTVTRDATGNGPSFQYVEAYRARPDAIALGRQLPLHERAADSQTILRWIDAL